MINSANMIIQSTDESVNRWKGPNINKIEEQSTDELFPID